MQEGKRKLCVQKSSSCCGVAFAFNSSLHPPTPPGVTSLKSASKKHLEKMAPVALQVHPEFAYSLLCVVGAYALHLWQMMQVGKMRKALKIFYPTMYSDKHPEFNCYQRVHQNTLEQVPFYLASVLAAGLRHPLVAAGAGLAWLAGRVVYSYGYYTGNPKHRMPGVFVSFSAQAVLLVGVVSTAAGLAGWW